MPRYACKWKDSDRVCIRQGGREEARTEAGRREGGETASRSTFAASRRLCRREFRRASKRRRRRRRGAGLIRDSVRTPRVRCGGGVAGAPGSGCEARIARRLRGAIEVRARHIRKPHPSDHTPPASVPHPTSSPRCSRHTRRPAQYPTPCRRPAKQSPLRATTLSVALPCSSPLAVPVLERPSQQMPKPFELPAKRPVHAEAAALAALAALTAFWVPCAAWRWFRRNLGSTCSTTQGRVNTTATSGKW